MIVSEGGKNIYPEDIENAFDGLPVKEFCIFAANYIWPKRQLGDEMLVMAIHLETGQQFSEDMRNEITVRNRRLPDFKRIGGYILWERDFPHTASLKIKRTVLAEEIAQRWPERASAVVPL
jgi:acyl-CoA synthetase (AMP-forming)/AMP-acid ligase II